MRTKQFILAWITLSLSLSVWADEPPIKWGKISKAEFNMQAPANDPDAPAIILCDYGQIEVTNRTFYKRHIRIKILKEEGVKYSSIEIPYRLKNKHDDITEFKAHIIYYENGKRIEKKMSQKDIYTVKVNDEDYKNIYTFPDIKPGTIIEFRYTIASLDFAELDTWYFQHEIPILWSEIRFKTPQYFTYLATFHKNEYLTSSEQEEYISKLNWMGLVKDKESRKELSKKNNVLYQSAQNNVRVFVVNNSSRRLILKDLPGYNVDDEDDDYKAKEKAPKLKFHLYESSGNLPWLYTPLLQTTKEDYYTKSRSELRHTSRPTGYVHYRLESWMEMNNRLLENSNFGLQLIKFFDTRSVFKNIITKGASDADKISAIYNYCQQKMEWNGIHSIYLPNGLSKPYKKGKGSSSEINLLMLYLLRKVDIEAYPVLIRTRDLGRPENLYPVRHQFNHVIVMVKVKDISIGLDATSNDPQIVLPRKNFNYGGWVVDKKEFGWVHFVKNNTNGKGVLASLSKPSSK